MIEKKEPSEHRSQGTVVPKVSGFPIDLWREWEVECKSNFGDCRWMKIWHDHLRAREFEEFKTLINKLNALEIRINNLEKKKEEENEKEDKESLKGVTFTG